MLGSDIGNGEGDPGEGQVASMPEMAQPLELPGGYCGLGPARIVRAFLCQNLPRAARTRCRHAGQ
jgi:hypothetical protein